MSAVARLAPQGAQRWMLVVQVQGEELEEARRESGAERQVGQRRRWREGRCEWGGGLDVQFCVREFLISLCSGTGKQVPDTTECGEKEGMGNIHDRQSSRTSDNR